MHLPDTSAGVSSSSRIEELRRRVLSDPASIAFAQLAEEYRRAGLLADAVKVCREGLAVRPHFVSARITLGRALLGLDQLDAAVVELTAVLDVSPDNLAALRTLAEARLRQGRLDDALISYRGALALAPNDPGLERRITDLTDTIAAASLRAAENRRARGAATIAALERWLEGIRAARSHQLS
jgi:tetratricopeptide (TPR) repeat protein